MNGIIVFGVAEPSRQNRAGIACISIRLMAAQTFQPARDLISVDVGRLFPGILRRHFFRKETLQNESPVAEV